MSPAALAIAQRAEEFGVDWLIWRLVLHPIGSLAEVRALSCGELAESHAAIDAQDGLKALGKRKP